MNNRRDLHGRGGARGPVRTLRTAGALFVAASTFALVGAHLAFAQDLTPGEYAARRSAVHARLGTHHVAVFRSALQFARTPSAEYPYRQFNNLLYLTGCQDADVTLAVFGTPVLAGGAQVHEILFVKPRNAMYELWNGPRLGPTEAQQQLGIASLPNDSLDAVLTRALERADTVYYDWAAPIVKESLPLRMRMQADQEKDLKAKFPSVQKVLPTGALTDSLRMFKSAAELALMQKAIDLSCAGHIAAQKMTRPGMFEYELAAEFDRTIQAGGAEALAYPDIVGSGPNACTIHYEANHRRIEPHELVLMDCGAEYHGYAADITRTFPVDGSFTPEQRAIYDLVLKAQLAGIAEVKPGAEFSAPHKKAVQVITDGLRALGILQPDSVARKYFPHGTSHTLGMDVHDTRAGAGTLAPGMVITVEPGIYIPAGSPCDNKWWNIGVRIEDDVLVTAEGSRVLSACVPK